MIHFVNQLDQQALLWINSWHAPWLDQIMLALSGQLIWLPFVLLLITVAAKELDKKSLALFLLFLVMAISASDVTSSYILKNLFNRLRPCRIGEIKSLMYHFGQKCGGKYGFVSSHAANSVVILAFTFKSLHRTPYPLYFIWLLPLLVGYSRIYLGVHYPGDVLGGFIVGGVWGVVLASFFQRRSSRGQAS